jgi:CPA1 family monovalent cation:H+ antiporter
MAGLELVLFLLAASAALQVLARRWRLPHPVLLVLGGAALALVPGLPRIRLDPETVFLVFVPPLLYWASFTTSLRDFWRVLWPIMRLGVLLVLITIGAVAFTAHALTPEFTWAAAFALAAIVAAPDPVAATAVMRPLGAPSTLVSILEGEGLVNDATALVAYRVAVAAAVTGSFSPAHATGGLLITGVGGVAVGLAVGWAIVRVRRQIRVLPVVENTVSLLTPFAAYLPANGIGVSGVLAVVAVGLYLGREGPRLTPAATRVQAEAMWSMVGFLLESLVFILTGFELPYVVRALRHHSPGQLLWYSLAISAVVIAVRMAYVVPSAYARRVYARLARADGRGLPPWRWVLFVGWAGVRGGDSLVIALALPVVTATGARFPARDLIIFVTFAVIFATLVLQGLTLRPLLRALKLGDDRRVQSEEAHARRVAAEAGLRRLEDVAARERVDADVFSRLRAKSRSRVRRWGALDRERHGADDDEHRALATSNGDEGTAASYRKVRGDMIAAERLAIVDLRDRGVIGDDVMRRIQRDLDLETMLLDGADLEGTATTPYEV